MGPGDLSRLLASLSEAALGDERVLVGPGTADDAGVYLLDGRALVATVDIITPVCDDARRFGWVAAANALSDVYAMGGAPLFALNLCCFPERLPQDVAADILAGAAEALSSAGAALLGGHSVHDDELKFGLAVVGVGDPDHLLSNAGARVGDRLIVTKPLGTGVLINAFKTGKIDAAALEPVLREMSRLNADASRLALEHGARAATDITGFGLVGHALEVARASDVAFELRLADLPVYEGFDELVHRGVSTGSTVANRESCSAEIEIAPRLEPAQEELLYDPQTSGGLLVAVPDTQASELLDALLESGHQAALVGSVLPAPVRVRIV